MSDTQLPSDELDAQAEYDEQADESRAMRMHIWRLHCRLRELASLMEMRSLTPVSERLIRECRELITEGAHYE